MQNTMKRKVNSNHINSIASSDLEHGNKLHEVNFNNGECLFVDEKFFAFHDSIKELNETEETDCCRHGMWLKN